MTISYSLSDMMGVLFKWNVLSASCKIEINWSSFNAVRTGIPCFLKALIYSKTDSSIFESSTCAENGSFSFSFSFTASFFVSIFSLYFGFLLKTSFFPFFNVTAFCVFNKSSPKTTSGSFSKVKGTTFSFSFSWVKTTDNPFTRLLGSLYSMPRKSNMSFSEVKWVFTLSPFLLPSILYIPCSFNE